MKTGKILKIALSMVKANKLRSWLTIIGVIIGIASVMAIVTTGEYFEKEVTETLEGFGGDTITIVASTPFHITDEEFVIENLEDPEESSEYSGVSSEINIETDRGKKETETDMSDYLESDSIEEAELTKMDVFALRSIPAIEYINVNVEKDAELKFGGESTWVWVKGVDPGVWPRISKKELEQGRMLKAGDRNVVVLSNELAKESFGKEIRLNQMILGGFTGLFGSSVYMPYQDVYSLASDEDLPERETYSSIELKLYKGADYSSSIQEIENKLRISRRVNEDTQDFYVNSNREAIEGVRKLINGLTAFLAFIAGISLLVGSTGIANTMFTSVLEKTKEIGIMKAIGAKNRDIMLIFLCNSAMISLVGGIIGILLGTAAVQAVLLFLSIRMNVPFEFALSLKAAFVATFVSILVGLIAGLVPVKNASELKPVDALRYE